MRILLVSLFLSCGLWAQSGDHMDSLQDGRYLGEGHWSDSTGESGHYQSYVEISANYMRADYTWHDGHKTINLYFNFLEDGWFDVSSDDEEIIGGGFCMSNQCTYTTQHENMIISEILSFHDNGIHRLGFKIYDDMRFRWDAFLQNLDYEYLDPIIDPGEPVDPEDPEEPINPEDPEEPEEPINPEDPEEPTLR